MTGEDCPADAGAIGFSSCEDCPAPLIPRPALRMRAISLASDVSGGESSGQRAAFACFGLLLTAELSTRCEDCATARVMAGIAMVASVELGGVS